MGHPATGPISPEEMRALADAPYGKAAEVLRKHDPAWGLGTADNPNIKWEVVLVGSAPVYAIVEVEAPTEEAARKMALALKVGRSDWEVDTYAGVEDIDVDRVDPA